MSVEEVLQYLETKLQDLQEENNKLHVSLDDSKKRIQDIVNMIMKSYSPDSYPNVEGLIFDDYGQAIVTDEKVLTESLINKGDFKTLVELSQVKTINSEEDEKLRKVLNYVNITLNKTEDFV